MARRSEKDMDRERSEIKGYERSYFKDLNTGSLRVRAQRSLFLCPFCDRYRRRDYELEDLLGHAKDVYRSSRSSTKDKGKHRALENYLKEQFVEKKKKEEENYLREQFVEKKKKQNQEEGSSSSRMKILDSNDDPVFVWPSMGVIANIATEYKDAKQVGNSGSGLRDELRRQGFNPHKVVPLWTRFGHSGFSIVHFKSEKDSDWTAFRNAIELERSFESQGCGRREYYNAKSRGNKLYGWVARAEDYHSPGLIGDHLRKKGDLKTVAQKEQEEKNNTGVLVSSLRDILETKNSHVQEMKSQLKKTDRSVNDLISAKDEMIKAHNEELNKIQMIARDHFETIFLEHENATRKLQAQQKELSQKERELELREVQDENKRNKLKLEKLAIEKAVVEQTKNDEKLLKLAKSHEREKEQLRKRLSKLQVELDNKQALELEIERLRGAFQVMEHIKEDDEEAQTKMKQLEKEMMAKEEELEFLDNMTQSLVVKERKSNDELQGARKEMISYLRTVTSTRATIGIKKMGELDTKAFQLAARRKYTKEDADIKAVELCSKWQEFLKDSNWHPFKMVPKGDQYVRTVNEDDERLKELREVYGDEVFQAVATALKEMNEYNASGGYVIPEIWNFPKGRKATLKEASTFLINQWRANKRKRK